MDIDELIARRLAALRKERELTLAQLAERCAVSKAMISRIEAQPKQPHRQRPRPSRRRPGVALSELLGDAQAPAEPLCRRAQQECGKTRPAATAAARSALATRSGCEMVEVEIPANARLDYPRWGGRPYRQRLWLVEVRCGWITASSRSTCNAATAWTSASTAR